MSNGKVQIYKGQQIAVYIDDISPSNVIFTFSGHGADPKNLYGDGFIQKLGFSGVFFVSLANHWWQTEELEEAIAIANEKTKTHNNRIAYGQSMGAYGALLCSARLQSRAVVTAPQTTLNSQNANIPQVWLNDISQFPIVRDNIEKELLNVNSIKIVYDPKDSWDISHVDHLKKHIHWLDEYKVPYATHNLPGTLKEMGIISSLIPELFKNETLNKYQFRKSIKANRSKSISYIRKLGTLTEKSKNKWLHGFYKKIATPHIEKAMLNIEKHSPETNNETLRNFNSKLLSTNQHVEIYDTEKLLFLSRENDPQLIFNNIPNITSTCNLSFFSSVESCGNIFFMRKINSTFSANDAINFTVKPGINHVNFDISGSPETAIEKIRFDPISCKGFFQILELNFESN